MNTNEVLPRWDNTTEYPSFTSKEWAADLTQLKSHIAKIESNLKSFSAALANPEETLTPAVLEGLQETLFTYSEAQILMYNLSSYDSF